MVFLNIMTEIVYYIFINLTMIVTTIDRSARRDFR